MADLKFISGSRSRYPRRSKPRSRAVDRRVALITSEYTRKAKAVDRDYCRHAQDTPGPVERRLQDFGDVAGHAFGVWGEASEAVHSLVHQIATSRLRTAMFLPHKAVKGKSSTDELAQLVGSVRRQLSVVAVDAQARLLLTGLRDK